VSWAGLDERDVTRANENHVVYRDIAPHVNPMPNQLL
jgi:hypothetical protein